MQTEYNFAKTSNIFISREKIDRQTTKRRRLNLAQTYKLKANRERLAGKPFQKLERTESKRWSQFMLLFRSLTETIRAVRPAVSRFKPNGPLSRIQKTFITPDFPVHSRGQEPCLKSIFHWLVKWRWLFAKVTVFFVIHKPVSYFLKDYMELAPKD